VEDAGLLTASGATRRRNSTGCSTSSRRSASSCSTWPTLTTWWTSWTTRRRKPAAGASTGTFPLHSTFHERPGGHPHEYRYLRCRPGCDYRFGSWLPRLSLGARFQEIRADADTCSRRENIVPTSIVLQRLHDEAPADHFTLGWLMGRLPSLISCGQGRLPTVGLFLNCCSRRRQTKSPARWRG
jgi:hypothetical protein